VLRSTLWLVLALLGQVAALSLIEAGPSVRFQHYVTLSDFSLSNDLLPLAVLVAQLVLVSVGVLRRRETITGWLRRSFRPGPLAVVLLAFVLSSAVLSKSIGVYVTELVFASAVQLISLGNGVLVVASLPNATRLRLSSALDRFFHRDIATGGRRPVDGFVVGIAIWVVAVAALLSTVSYQRHPHVPDEVIYLMQARTFAAGMVTVPAPPVPEAFDVDITVLDGDRWYSPAPPGWPAILALGVKVGLAWLVNPVLAGLCILLTYSLIVELYDRQTARLAIALLAVSPWLLFMGMNFMTHSSSLAAALLAGLFALRGWRTNRVGWFAMAGTATALLSLIRPLEAVAVALVIGVLLLWKGPGLSRLTRLAVFGVAAAASVMPMLIYNKALTGSAFSFPLTNYVPRGYSPTANALGFGPDRGFDWTGLDPLPGHGFLDILINDALNTALVNAELFGWGTGSLLFILAFLAGGKLRRADWTMLGVIGAVIFVHSFYWFSGGPDFGARYWYLIILPCVVLTARGIQMLDERLQGGRSERSYAATLLAGVLCLVSVSTFIPWRAFDKYRHYRGMRPDILKLAESHGFGRSLVLVRGDRHPDYASVFTYNPLDLRSDGPIYAWDKDPAVRQQVVAAYPDRPVWFVDGPCITGRGYELVSGPWPADSLE
jgi:hypothetical protein